MALADFGACDSRQVSCVLGKQAALQNATLAPSLSDEHRWFCMPEQDMGTTPLQNKLSMCCILDLCLSVPE